MWVWGVGGWELEKSRQLCSHAPPLLPTPYYRNHIIQDPQRPDQQVDDVAEERRLLVLVDAVPDELKNPSEDEEGDVEPHRKPRADEVERDRNDQHGDGQPPFEREVVDDGDGDQ